MTVTPMTAGNIQWYIASLTDPDTGHVSVLGTFLSPGAAAGAVAAEATRLRSLPEVSEPVIQWTTGEKLAKTTGLCR